MERRGVFVLPALGEREQAHAFPRRDVRDRDDRAADSERRRGKRRSEVAARDLERLAARRAHELRQLRDVAAAVLHAEDVRMRSQSSGNARRHIDPGGRRHRVERDRDRRGVGDRLVVPPQRLFARPAAVEERVQDERPVAPLVGGAARQRDRLPRRCASGSGDDAHPRRRGRAHRPEDERRLLRRQVDRLAVRPERHVAGQPGPVQTRDVLAQEVEGEVAVLGERRGEGRKDAFEEAHGGG